MNMLDHTVKEVLNVEYQDFHDGSGCWITTVIAHCWGRDGKSTLVFKTEEEARAVKAGDTFLA